MRSLISSHPIAFASPTCSFADRTAVYVCCARVFLCVCVCVCTCTMHFTMHATAHAYMYACAHVVCDDNIINMRCDAVLRSSLLRLHPRRAIQAGTCTCTFAMSDALVMSNCHTMWCVWSCVTVVRDMLCILTHVTCDIWCAMVM